MSIREYCAHIEDKYVSEQKKKGSRYILTPLFPFTFNTQGISRGVPLALPDQRACRNCGKTGPRLQHRWNQVRILVERACTSVFLSSRVRYHGP